MEPSVLEGNHGTARSKTSRTLSTVAGLSMNKHGLSMNTLRSHRPQQVYVALPPPPLNFNNSNSSPPLRKHSLDSKTMGSHSSSSSSPLATSPPMDISTDDPIPSDAHDLALPCRTIVFAASTLHDAMKRCLLHIPTSAFVGNNAPLSFFVPLLQQIHRAYDSLETINSPSNDDTQQQQPATTDALVSCVNRCLTSLKEICTQLQSRLDDLAQVLDVKMLRHLLLVIHGVTFDIKDAWQLVVASTTTATEITHVSQRTYNSNNEYILSSSAMLAGGGKHSLFGGPPLPSPQVTRNRSHSENNPPSNGKQSTTTTTTTTSGLYAHLRMAVAASSQLVDVLNQSMDTMLQDMVSSQRRNHGGLEKKLMVLRQPMQQAMVCSHQLNEHLDTIQEHGFTSHQTYTIQFWEDTNLFLKTFVSLMSLIRSLSTEEDINWPKSVKQCCLHVTRVTAEIAKLWNNDPTFVQDGYYLGKAGGDDSTTAPSPAATTATATATSVPLSSSVPSSSSNVTTSAISLSSSAPSTATTTATTTSTTTTNAFILDSNVAPAATPASSFLDIPIPPK